MPSSKLGKVNNATNGGGAEQEEKNKKPKGPSQKELFAEAAARKAGKAAFEAWKAQREAEQAEAEELSKQRHLERFRAEAEKAASRTHVKIVETIERKCRTDFNPIGLGCSGAGADLIEENHHAMADGEEISLKVVADRDEAFEKYNKRYNSELAKIEALRLQLARVGKTFTKQEIAKQKKFLQKLADRQ